MSRAKVSMCIPVELSTGWIGFVIALECEHWFKSGIRIEPGFMVDCVKCTKFNLLRDEAQ
jgi:hypothetical protein